MSIDKDSQIYQVTKSDILQYIKDKKQTTRLAIKHKFPNDFVVIIIEELILEEKICIDRESTPNILTLRNKSRVVENNFSGSIIQRRYNETQYSRRRKF